MCESLEDGVVVADEEGQFVFWNRAAEKMLGLGALDFLAHEPSSAYGCFEADGVTPFPADRLPLARAARGESVEEIEFIVRNPRYSADRWLRISGAPVRDGTGAHRGGVVLFHDVTERRRAEESIQRLANAVEQTADAVLMTDPEGRIEYVNHGFEVMTGWSSAEVIGKTPRILKSGEHGDGFYRDLWESLRRGEVFRGMFVNIRKDATRWYATQTITPMVDAGGCIRNFVSVMRDETQPRRAARKEVEMELAATIQRRLYPRRQIEVAGLEVDGFVLSADATCGDYYDWVQLGEDGIGIVVGDVVGHGVGPALIMAETRAYLRSLATLGLPPGEVLRRLGALLHPEFGAGQFVTLLLAYLDMTELRLTHANAGHPPGWVLDAHGGLKATLGGAGLPLGMWPDSTYPESRGVALDRGDLVLLLTDGVTECRDESGRILDEGPILDIVRAQVREPLPVILDHMRELLSTFRGGRPTEDDATVLVCRVLGGPSSGQCPT